MVLSPVDKLYRNPRNTDLQMRLLRRRNVELKIHRCFKMRIHECKNDYSRISSNAQHVGEKSKNKNQNFQLWILCMSK